MVDKVTFFCYFGKLAKNEPTRIDLAARDYREKFRTLESVVVFRHGDYGGAIGLI